MARAHVRESFTVRYPPALQPVIAVGAVVHVYDVGTSTPISGSTWSAKTGGSDQGNPITADASGAVDFWLDTDRPIDLVVEYPGVSDRRITVDPTRDASDIIHASGTETRGAGLTLTSPVLNTPTINNGTFTSVSLTNPTISGGSWANGTISNPSFSTAISGAMTVLGTGTGGKGGLAVNTDGGITFGRQVSGGAVPSSMIAGNWEMPSTGAGFALVNLAAVAQASGADSVIVTATAFEGWTTSWQTPVAATGPASNYMAAEFRMDLGTDTNIAAGYHNSRTVGGFGLNTNTQASVSSDGTNTVDQVGVKVESGGTFPATNRAGGAQSTAGTRGGAALWLSHGQNGWYNLIVATKLGASVSGVAIVPAFAVTKEGWVGSNVWATARFHGKWESGVDAANADIAIMESDNTGALPSHYVARGLTATTKRLAIGVNTSSNFGSVDALNTSGSVAMPLFVNASGGAVVMADTSHIGLNGATGTRLFVKQSSDAVNGGGVTVARSGAAGNLQNATVWAESGKANFSAWLPGTSSTTMSLTNAGAIQINGTQLLAGTRQTTPTNTARTADATYDANEAAMLNELKAAVATVITSLGSSGHGLWT